MKVLFVFLLLLIHASIFAQTPTVKPTKSEYFLNDTLSFNFDGVIYNDGGYEWNPLWGVLKFTEKGWDTLIDVKSRVIMKEIAPISLFQNYKRHFIIIDTIRTVQTDNQLIPEESLFQNDGKYILTILSGDRKQLICSEPFSISTKTTIDPKLAKNLNLIPDTVFLGNNQFVLEASLWRDFAQVGGSQTICHSELTGINNLNPNEIQLKRQYVVHGKEIWIGEYEQIKTTKSTIEAKVRNGPKWLTNSKVNVICEFEYLGLTYRVSSRSRLIGRVE